MPRITDDQLHKLKTDISLVRLIESSGHQLKKEGRDHVMCCPFHEDDTPSLKVSVSKNVFNCFGCGASGTTIDWVMKTQGVSFRHACEILLEGIGLDAGIKKATTVPKLSSPLAADADNQTVLNQVIDYYHESLKQTPEALDYLASRGLNHPELIETFKLGFAGRTLGLRLPEKSRVAGKAIRSQLQEVGILRQSGHEHLNGSLVVPIMDGKGDVVEAYGRKINNKLRKGTPKHLYLPGPHAGVFNAQALVSHDEIILCESLIDAMTFWVHGFRNVTTSYGTGGFTDEVLQTCKKHQVKRILIAYDRDKAGNEAATELSKKLNSEGIDTFRILFPKNMDVNDYALSVQPASKALGIAIRKAEWLGNGAAPEITTGLTELQKATKKESELPSFTTPVHPAPAAVEHPCSPDSSSVPEALPEPSAAVMPKTANQIDAEVTDHEINITFGQRSYRIRGLAKNMSYEQLKVNVMVALGENYHLDTIDMYSSKARASYIKQAAIELGVSNDTIKKDLGQILIKLEELQEAQIKSKLNPAEQPEPTLSESETAEALELLKSPDLLNRITDDLTASGIVGENTNKLAAYLGCVSRKLDKPLAIIIQSTSAAGKSTLMDRVIELMPEADKVQYSAMTGQSLFYMGETSLRHKILAISEEEGAHNASYALKLLQSEGKVTIASTGKDEATGNMETKEYTVQGPVMLFMTTTAIDIDEELLNRCLVLTVNETREQTEAIHQMQRQAFTLKGLQADTQKQTIIQTHQNAQSLIRPLKVVNPYADQLTFMSNKTRTRRDHMKYLNLINTIALLHQYQRDIQTQQNIEYIEVEISDIEWANKLAHNILGRTLDELPPQTRSLLEKIKQMVDQACEAESLSRSDYRFTRRQIREYTDWGNTQVRVHLSRLEEMEYVLVHRGGRGQSFVYELAYGGQDDQGQAFLNGLIDTEKLQYDGNLAGQKDNLAGSKRPQNGGKTGGGRGAENTLKSSDTNGFEEKDTEIPQNALLGKQKNGAHPVVPAH